MPRFKVEQYELHVASYEVEAKDRADAVYKVRHGAVDAPLDVEFIETADRYGLVSWQHPELATTLAARMGVAVGKRIPSVRSVEACDD